MSKEKEKLWYEYSNPQFLWHILTPPLLLIIFSTPKFVFLELPLQRIKSHKMTPPPGQGFCFCHSVAPGRCSGDAHTALDLWRRGISCSILAGHLKAPSTLIPEEFLHQHQLTFILSCGFSFILAAIFFFWCNYTVHMVTPMTQIKWRVY